MEMKVVQIGNSAGVVIPKQIRKDLGIRVGENVSLNKMGKKIVINNPKKKNANKVDLKFVKMVDEFMNEHEDALQELAKR